MIDIATYDHAETTAHGAVRSWTWPAMMVPTTFTGGGFPVRAHTLHDLRPLLDAMHYYRFERTVAELNGLADDEVEELLQALVRFCRFAAETFGEVDIPLPLNTMITCFLTSRKLMGLPKRARVLELGAGCGYVPFFCPRNRGFEERHQVEVTQSLYILQSRINAFVYRGRLKDFAMQPPPPARVGTMADRMALRHGWHEPQGRIRLAVQAEATLYPWWHIDDALDSSRKYDVVVSNANLAEMSHAAMLYYFDGLTRCLAPDGVVLIEDLGAQSTDGDYAIRLRTLTQLGYRPLVHGDGAVSGGRLATDNLLLVRDGHPNWNDAGARCQDKHFPDHLAIVRAVYGLDRPKARMLSRSDLFTLARQRLGA